MKHLQVWALRLSEINVTESRALVQPLNVTHPTAGLLKNAINITFKLYSIQRNTLTSFEMNSHSVNKLINTTLITQEVVKLSLFLWVWNIYS